MAEEGEFLDTFDVNSLDKINPNEKQEAYETLCTILAISDAEFVRYFPVNDALPKILSELSKNSENINLNNLVVRSLTLILELVPHSHQIFLTQNGVLTLFKYFNTLISNSQQLCEDDTSIALIPDEETTNQTQNEAMRKISFTIEDIIKCFEYISVQEPGTLLMIKDPQPFLDVLLTCMNLPYFSDYLKKLTLTLVSNLCRKINDQKQFIQMKSKIPQFLNSVNQSSPEHNLILCESIIYMIDNYIRLKSKSKEEDVLGLATPQFLSQLLSQFYSVSGSSAINMQHTAASSGMKKKVQLSILVILKLLCAFGKSRMVLCLLKNNHFFPSIEALLLPFRSLSNDFLMNDSKRNLSLEDLRSNDKTTWMCLSLLQVMISLLSPNLIKKFELETLRPVVLPVYDWFWEDDFHSFHRYDDISCRTLENGFSNALNSIILTVPGVGASYRIDFQTMQQYNTASNVMRNVKRDPIPKNFIVEEAHRASKPIVPAHNPYAAPPKIGFGFGAPGHRLGAAKQNLNSAIPLPGSIPPQFPPIPYPTPPTEAPGLVSQATSLLSSFFTPEQRKTSPRVVQHKKKPSAKANDFLFDEQPAEDAGLSIFDDFEESGSSSSKASTEETTAPSANVKVQTNFEDYGPHVLKIAQDILIDLVLNSGILQISQTAVCMIGEILEWIKECMNTQSINLNISTLENFLSFACNLLGKHTRVFETSKSEQKTFKFHDFIEISAAIFIADFILKVSESKKTQDLEILKLFHRESFGMFLSKLQTHNWRENFDKDFPKVKEALDLKLTALSTHFLNSPQKSAPFSEEEGTKIEEEFSKYAILLKSKENEIISFEKLKDLFSSFQKSQKGSISMLHFLETRFASSFCQYIFSSGNSVLQKKKMIELISFFKANPDVFNVIVIQINKLLSNIECCETIHSIEQLKSSIPSAGLPNFSSPTPQQGFIDHNPRDSTASDAFLLRDLSGELQISLKKVGDNLELPENVSFSPSTPEKKKNKKGNQNIGDSIKVEPLVTVFSLAKYIKKKNGIEDKEIEIFMNGEKIPQNKTIIEAIIETNFETQPKIGNFGAIFNTPHEIQYKIISESQENSKKETSNSSDLMSFIQNPLLCLSEEQNIQVPSEIEINHQKLKNSAFGSLDEAVSCLNLLKLLFSIKEMNAETSNIFKSTSFVIETLNSSLVNQFSSGTLSLFFRLCNSLPAWPLDFAKCGISNVLFALKTRIFYFHLFAFGWHKMITKMFNKQNSKSGNLHGDTNNDRIGFVGSKTFKIANKEKILDEAVQILDSECGTKTNLEFEFEGEAGTGLGPTQSFYTRCCRDIQKKELGIWVSDSEESKDNSFVNHACGLFPSFLSFEDNKSEKFFVFLGRLIGKGLENGKLIDLPLNFHFVELVLGKKFTISMKDLSEIEPFAFKTLKLIKGLVNEKKIGSTPELAQKIENLSLDFNFVGHPLLKNGENSEETEVSIENIEVYHALLQDFLLEEFFQKPVQWIRKGLNDVFDSELLSFFTPQEFLNFVFGGNTAFWKNNEETRNIFEKIINCEHGYSKASQEIKWFISILLELDAAQQREFVDFLTGSPRLPVLGLESLKLTVVKRAAAKETKESIDATLPTCNTCFHFFKLPKYSSQDIMKERLLFAIKNGIHSFDLS